jgi:hypothetical protein
MMIQANPPTHHFSIFCILFVDLQQNSVDEGRANYKAQTTQDSTNI